MAQAIGKTAMRVAVVGSTIALTDELCGARRCAHGANVSPLVVIQRATIAKAIPATVSALIFILVANLRPYHMGRSRRFSTTRPLARRPFIAWK